jgi:hypothetical protein
MEDVEVLLKGFLGSGEQHLHFQGGAIGAPVDEDAFGNVHVVGVGELVVEDCISVLFVGKRFQEIVPVLLFLAQSLNDLIQDEKLRFSNSRC